MRKIRNRRRNRKKGKTGPWEEEGTEVIKEQKQEQDQEKEQEQDFLLGCESSVCLTNKKIQQEILR